MKRDVWGIFHDGVLTRIRGVVPGAVTLEIKIAYLRRMFDEPGKTFAVELLDCSQFRYNDYEQGVTEDIAKLNELEPEILYVSSEFPLLLDCVMGSLELEYAAIRITLPSGVDVSYESLISASDRYWSEWSSRANSV